MNNAVPNPEQVASEIKEQLTLLERDRQQVASEITEQLTLLERECEKLLALCDDLGDATQALETAPQAEPVRSKSLVAATLRAARAVANGGTRVVSVLKDERERLCEPPSR
jgi:hypothetical protein